MTLTLWKAGQQRHVVHRSLRAAGLVDEERRLHLMESENQMSQIEIIEKPLPGVRLAAHTTRVPDYEVGGAVGPLFAGVEAVLAVEYGARATPIAQYRSTDQGMEITAGYAYNGEPRAEFEIVDLPAVELAVCGVHLGEMARIRESWGAVHAEILARGFVPSGPCRELYVQAEGEDQTDWVTELQQPVSRP